MAGATDEDVKLATKEYNETLQRAPNLRQLGHINGSAGSEDGSGTSQM